MKHFNLILGIVSFLPWIALPLYYYKDRILPWMTNRFTRDKRPKGLKIKNGYFPDGASIPFRENLYPSDTTSKEGSVPGETEAAPPSSQSNNKEKDSDRT